MTYNLALQGLRYALYHSRPARTGLGTILRSVTRLQLPRSHLNQIRNASSAFAAADYRFADQAPEWSSATGGSPQDYQEDGERNQQKYGSLNEKRRISGLPSQVEMDVENDRMQVTVNPSLRESGDENEHATSDALHDPKQRAAADSDHAQRPDLKSPASLPKIQPIAPRDAKTKEIVQALYALLRKESGYGRTEKIKEILEELVVKHKEPPNLRLYQAMIRANHSSEFGSAGAVESILKEMREEGIEPDARCYHDALTALAVHPDCFLREQLVVEMKERWIPIDQFGQYMIIAGEIREGLMEQALELFYSNKEFMYRAPKWLKDMFIYYLCDLGELDQALKMLKDRVAQGEVNISRSVWFYFFDHACSSLHSEAVQFIWHQRVERRLLVPSSMQCLQALTVGGRTGNVPLSTDVFRVLASRNIAFRIYHYELMIATQLAAGDIRTALTIICIMHAVNMRPKMASLTPFLTYLADDPTRPAEAFEILKDLREEREVPTVAVNCVLVSLVGHGAHDDVITTYKSLHRISKQGPDVDTFNILFRSCHRNNDKKTAMFFAAEMVQLKIRPNSLTYDRLVLVCLVVGDFEDAFRYLDEMMRNGYQPRVGTWTKMVKDCCDARDERAFELVQMMTKCGARTHEVVYYLREHWAEVANKVFGVYGEPMGE